MPPPLFVKLNSCLGRGAKELPPRVDNRNVSFGNVHSITSTSAHRPSDKDPNCQMDSFMTKELSKDRLLSSFHSFLDTSNSSAPHQVSSDSNSIPCNDSTDSPQRVLPHLEPLVGGLHSQNRPMLVVYDNCATDGLISLQFLVDLQKSHNIEFCPLQPGQAPRIQGAVETANTRPIGKATIYLRFQNEEKTDYMTIPYSVWVIKKLQAPIFIGNDLIFRKGFRKFEDDKAVTFNIPDRPNETLRVPIIFKSVTSSVNVIISHKTVLRPFETKFVTSRLDFDIQDKHHMDYKDVILTSGEENGVQATDSLVTVQDGSVPVILSNPTDKKIVIHKGAPVATVEPLDNLQVHETSFSQEELQPEETPVPMEKIIDLTHLPEKKRSRMWNILRKYRNAFSTCDMDIGLVDFHEHTIPLNSELPKPDKQRLQPRDRRDDAKKLIRLLVKHGIIEPCTSPFASNVSMVRKKSGKWRLVLDARRLNKCTLDTKITLGIQEDLLQRIAHCKYRSSIDMSSGYHQIPLKESDRYKTAFYSPDGSNTLYQYRVMSMGLSSSSTTFTEMMHKVFHDLDFVVFYLDDILICSQTYKEHLEHIEIVLKRLTQANLKLDPKKCEFAASRIKFLGYDITFDTIKIPQAKSEALRSIQTPTKKKDLLSFLAAFSYYRKFIKDFASIAEPLYALIRKDTKFIWKDAHENAINALKDALAASVELYIPTPHGSFTLSTDSSLTGFGALLEQEDEKGNKRLVACASKSLKDAQTRHAIHELEAEALLWAIKHFDFYLRHVDFIVQTDSRAILFLSKATEINDKFCRWVEELAKYSFTIVHVPGKFNYIPDLLSRQGESVLKKQKSPLSKYTIDMLISELDIAAKTLIPSAKIKNLFDTSLLYSLDRVKEKNRQQKIEKAFRKAAKSSETANSTVENVIPAMITTRSGAGKDVPPVSRTSRQFAPATQPVIQTTEQPHVQFQPRSATQPSLRRPVEEIVRDSAREIAQQLIEQAADQAAVQAAEQQHVVQPPSPPSQTSSATLTAPTPPSVDPSHDSLSRDFYDLDTADSHDVTHVDDSDDSDTDVINLYPMTHDPDHSDPAFSATEDSIDDSEQEDEPDLISPTPVVQTTPDDADQDQVDEPPVRSTQFPTQPSQDSVSTVSNDSLASDSQLIPPTQNEDPYRFLMQDLSSTNTLSTDNMIRMQKQDAFCRKVVHTIEHQGNDKYLLKNGLLITSSRPPRIVLPQKLIFSVVWSAHYTYYGAHTSKERTKNHLLSKFKAPKLAETIDSVIDSCFFCQMNRPYTKPPKKQGTQRMPIIPRTAISMDLAVSLPESNGTCYKHILVIVDLVTGFVSAIPLMTRTSSAILDGLIMGWITTMGIPSLIVTDNELGFKHGALKQYCQLYQIELKHSIPANPTGNGAAEAAVKIIKQALKSLPEARKRCWPSYLYLICSAINSKVSARNRLSPESCMFGYEIPRPYWKIPYVKDEPQDDVDAYQRFLALADIRSAERARLLRNMPDRHRPEVQKGSLVLKKILQRSPHKGSHALEYKYEGPYLVTSAAPYKLFLKHILTGKEVEAHRDHVKPFTKPDPKIYNLPSDWDKFLKLD